MSHDSHNINGLARKVDELSIQKSLPLRQLTAKPSLRTSQSEPGLIRLYHGLEPTQNKSVLPSRKQQSYTGSDEQQKLANDGRQDYIPSSNPYIRPLSAKDYLTAGIDKAKINANILPQTNYSSQYKQYHAPESEKGAGESSTNHPNHNTSATITTTKVISIKSTNNTVAASPRERFEQAVYINSGEHGARPPLSIMRPLSSRIRNPNYSPVKTHSLTTELVDGNTESETKMRKGKSELLNDKICQAISTLNKSKAGSVTQVGGDMQSLTSKTPQLSGQTNTPHLTPKKENVAVIECDKVDQKNQLESIIESVNRKSDIHTKKVDSQKEPKFYLKSSRPETRLIDLRPSCEGQEQTSTGNERNTIASTLESCNAKIVKKDSSNTKVVRDTAGVSKSGPVADEDEDAEEENCASTLSERMPGDGETDDDSDEMDDGINGLDDDDLEDIDDDSDSDSISSDMTRVKSASTEKGRFSSDNAEVIRMKSARRRVNSSYLDGTTQPALIKSLFPHVPPYINFVDGDDKIEQLPWQFRKLLKWRMCSITPNVVKNCIAKSGFRPTKKHYDWLGCWGRHLKAQGFKSIREYQKLNHFPGSFQIGRKDRLWKNLSRLQVLFGKKEFNFFPTTYVLPKDLKDLKRAWEDSGNNLKWIIKPPASARGIGIKVINKWNHIPKKRPVIVQKYIAKPLLINGAKFDCRVYVYVTSYDPLRIYVYEDGLVRFCSTKYSHSMKHIHNKYMHLTNYSIQKKSEEYESNQDENQCQGHKWSLKALWGYLMKNGVNTNEIWKTIKDLVVKTIISAESSINSYIKANVRSRYSVHELFGFDILLDETYKPWVLEVNISPSLHSNSQLDISVKGAMIKDLHNLAGFRIPDKHDVVPNPGSDSYKLMAPSNKYCMDKRVVPQSLSSDEKAKHAYYSQRHPDSTSLSSILDILTPDDFRMLIESIDEDSRKGGFQRVFPTPSSNKYHCYFESPRYYNLLLDQWCQRFNKIEAKGIAIIETACYSKIHLHNPTEDVRYQWCPPSPLQSSSSVTNATFPKLKPVSRKTADGNARRSITSTAS